MIIPLVDLKSQYASIKKEIDAALSVVLTEGSFCLGPAVQGFEQGY